MDFRQLLSIYPTAVLAEDHSRLPEVLSIPYEEQWIHLKKEDLSATEVDLLRTLFPIRSSDDFSSVHPIWYDYLLKNAPLPERYEGTYRIIQFEVATKEASADLISWLDAFRHSFNFVDDCFFIHAHYGILVQKYGGIELSYEEITGVLQALEDDFSIKAVCYLGQYWQISEQFPILFNEEKTIFLQQKEQQKGLTVLSLSQVALPYYVKSATESSRLINELKTFFYEQSDWIELIKALWETQGNISMAAKRLYVHRNTLQYRMDRFTESTGFSLKNKDDLMLCYLLLL